ncbi:hypothetical protein LEUCIP111803_02387 [Leucobacter soli]|uniref:Helicase XPB/Ssl2 N-terminal domain-containing protein n=3 Tax=Leucobacter soli TaxID=2812850 RepID=A0A916K1I4_9MICO|nr:helicase-associated domain-containing protein [Leucobacter soli]CAG7620752.1 hypothetical protein LEUCIP111803_02387 [Leucobacter soli]
MSGTLRLAASIAAMDRDELRGLLAARPVAALRSVDNPLALALELLRPDSITAVLRGLDRTSLAVLRGEAEGDDDELRRLGLRGLEDGRAVLLPEVGETLRKLSEAPGSADAPRQSGVPGPVDADPGAVGPGILRDPASADIAHWYGAALASTVRAAALLRALSHRPVRLSRKGTVTVVALRELALVAHDTPEAIGRLAGLLRIAGLAVPIQRPGGQTLLCPSTEADSWLELTQPHRWAVLAEALAERLPAPLARAIELADGDLHLAVDSVLGAEFPLLPHSLRAEATEWAGAAEQLGLAVDGRLTPAALELFAGTPGAAASAAERDFPPPAAGVYLQPDLSLIVPGPLAPADERALLEIVETEQLGVASTMRLSQMSLSRALRAGHEVGAIRELLERLSLTGIPQPLDFLLGDLERRRPGPDPEEALAAAWAGRRAGPADPPGGTSSAEPARGGSTAPAASAGSDEPDELAAAVERIHSAARASRGSGELTHRLELAIRDRSPVRVTAVGPDERTFLLLPISLAGGRLRATDEAAGVERTLPVSAITAVEAA